MPVFCLGQSVKFEQIRAESPENFQRLTGIKRSMFNSILNTLKNAEIELKSLGGKPAKLSIENRLLMALEYWREYRTYFHISRSYGVSESTCYRNIQWVEDALVKSGKFSLLNPKKEALAPDNGTKML